MSLPRTGWVLVLALALPASALAADPLPEGAVVRFSPSGTKYGDPHALLEVRPNGTWAKAPDTRQALSPDGKLYVLISDDHAAHLCRRDTRQELRQLRGHTAYLADAAFSPDGKTIASGSNDRTLRLWDADTGKELHVCAGHEDQVCAVAFAPDGKTVASASWDGSVRLWDVASGKELRRLEGHRYEVRGVGFAPDGKTLVSGGTDGTVRLWDAATGKEVRRWAVDESGVRAVTFTPDGKAVITVDGIHDLRRWDVNAAGGARLPYWGADRPESDSLYCAAFAPDGKTVALGRTDGTIRLHDATTGKELRVVGRHPGIVWSVAFSPDGKTLASSARRHGVVRLWDVGTGRMVRSYPGHAGGVSRVLFTPDGKRLIAAGGSFDPSLIVYDTPTAKELRRLEGHANLVDALAVSADGRWLASAAGSDPVRLWDLTTGKERRRWPAAGDLRGPLAFSADGGCLLVTEPSGAPGFHDVATGKPRRCLTNLSSWAALSPDGRTIAAATTEHAIALVEVMTGQERRTFDARTRGGWVVFSPDGRRLLTEANDGTALLWDLTGGARAGLEPRERDDLWRDLAGPDGRRAYDAVWRLALSPRESVPLLRRHVRPSAPADSALIIRRVAELDDDEFAVREKASEDLARAGEAARAALERAADAPASAEVRRRAVSLLANLDGGTSGPEALRELRALEVLEHAGTPEARQVLEGLTKGAPEARLTREAKASLERLGRR
jgi:WD40 repeat protein